MGRLPIGLMIVWPGRLGAAGAGSPPRPAAHGPLATSLLLGKGVAAVPLRRGGMRQEVVAPLQELPRRSVVTVAPQESSSTPAASANCRDA